MWIHTDNLPPWNFNENGTILCIHTDNLSPCDTWYNFQKNQNDAVYSYRQFRKLYYVPQGDKLSVSMNSTVLFCWKFYHVSQWDKLSVGMHSIVRFCLKFYAFIPTIYLLGTSMRTERYCAFILTIYFSVIRGRTSNKMEQKCGFIPTIYLLGTSMRTERYCAFILTNSSWIWYLYFRKLIGRFRRLQKEIKLSVWIHSSIPFCLKFYHVSQRNKLSVWMHSIVPWQTTITWLSPFLDITINKTIPNQSMN
jgi:hypothetical protein